MKRFATLVLLAGFGFAAPARAADLDNLPTVPSAPALPASTHGGGASVDVSRGTMPPRGQTGWTLPSNNWRQTSQAPTTTPTKAASPSVTQAAVPAPSTSAGAANYGSNGPLVLPTGYKLSGETRGTVVAAPSALCASPACAAQGCESSRGSCYERFKAWFCFRPTAGDALPKLNPHPYIGPIAGTFPCGPNGTCGAPGGCATGACGNGGACANGAGDSGRFGGILAARGCKGGCVPPADDAIAGYRFAGAESPKVAAPVVQPTGYTTYKPAQSGTASQVKPAANSQPAGDPLARPYTRP